MSLPTSRLAGASLARQAALWSVALASALALSSPAAGQAPAPSPSQPADTSLPRISETMEVTATRVPEDVEGVPASVTVVTGEELAATGAWNLATALANVSGVAIAPGGDAGPASSVPELWGLREFDAFLLVVDGVPWGGAFNPALSTLDLTDVDRIEVLRGSAPVMYGATSFVGVIQVIHRDAGAPGGTVRAWGGSFGTGGGSASTPLPAIGDYKQSLIVNGDRQGFSQDRTGWDRGHLLYRGSLTTDAGGTLHIDFDDAVVDQKPGSPTPRTGSFLTPLVPVDSNENGLDAKVDVARQQLNLGYDQKLAFGTWSTLVSGAHTDQTVARAFLENVTGDNPDAHGIRQHLDLTDLYLDTHLAFSLAPSFLLIAGADNIYGKSHNASGDWDFLENVNGSNPPNINSFSPFGTTDLRDDRNFSGLYAQGEWTPTHRWRVQLGARLNHTHESLVATSINLVPDAATLAAATAAAALAGQKDVSVGPGTDRRNVTRGSGSAGVSYLAWEAGKSSVWVYGDYRNTFKPAALDFGPDVNGVILKPETSQSWEAGVKGRMMEGRLDWEAGLFQMNFSNLVVGQLDPATGNPELVNAGNERFKGIELEAGYRLVGNLRLQGEYSYHDAKYTNYLALDDDGVLEQLAGDRLPMSAHNLAGVGFIYYPKSGFTGWATLNYTGSRYLDPENTALAAAYASIGAGLGYRRGAWELRLDAWNLTNTRPPISASELGDDQFYRLDGRSFRGTVAYRFL